MSFTQDWNIRFYDGGGDTGFVYEITRSFSIEQQCERGYFGTFREPFASEVVGEMLADHDPLDDGHFGD